MAANSPSSPENAQAIWQAPVISRIEIRETLGGSTPTFDGSLGHGAATGGL